MVRTTTIAAGIVLASAPMANAAFIKYSLVLEAITSPNPADTVNVTLEIDDELLVLDPTLAGAYLSDDITDYEVTAASMPGEGNLIESISEIITRDGDGGVRFIEFSLDLTEPIAPDTEVEVTIAFFAEEDAQTSLLQFNPLLIPTPGSMALVGLAGLAAIRRRRSA